MGRAEIAMKTFDFTIIAAGLDAYASDFEDRLFEAGCDDATISLQKGAIILEFHREAKNFSHAVDSAIADVEEAGGEIVHVEPDYLVSLSDIAVRTGITRAAASNYAAGKRGAEFPAPVARVTTESPLWDWLEVCRWFHRQGRVPLQMVLQARVIRGANLRLLTKRELRPVAFGSNETRRVHAD